MLPVAKEQVSIIRQRVTAPINMNFFCHKSVAVDPRHEAEWRRRLAPYYQEFGLDPAAPVDAANRAPFDAAMCELVEELKPLIVSFHFGLPERALMARVKAAGCLVMSSATTVREAIWLDENGADIIIAQGAEAGGPPRHIPDRQYRPAARHPCAGAAGGGCGEGAGDRGGRIADGRGIAAAFALGAAGVQIGTAYLRCPGSEVSAAARAALGERATVQP